VAKSVGLTEGTGVCFVEGTAVCLLVGPDVVNLVGVWVGNFVGRCVGNCVVGAWDNVGVLVCSYSVVGARDVGLWEGETLALVGVPVDCSYSVVGE
jgi:hypothetical protein